MSTEDVTPKAEEVKEAPEIPDDQLALMTEEQRVAYMSGEEVDLTHEQEALFGSGATGKPDAEKGTPQEKKEGDAPAPTEPGEVIQALETKIKDVPPVKPEQVERSSSFKRLRNRAQKAEARLKELERKAAEYEAENRAYKESLAALKSADADEDSYDLTDPEQLEKYIKAIAEEELGGLKGKQPQDGAKPPADGQEEFIVLPPEATAQPESRFIDAAGTSYDKIVKENPSDKAYFIVKNSKTGEQKVLYDKTALAEYDKELAERVGPELYRQMWGTAENPGLMSWWRDNAPESDVVALLNADDLTIATVEIYKQLLGQLQQQQAGQQPGISPQAQTQQSQPGIQMPKERPPVGLGPAPTTSDAAAFGRKPKPEEYTDEQLAKMTEEERNKYLNMAV